MARRAPNRKRSSSSCAAETLVDLAVDFDQATQCPLEIRRSRIEHDAVAALQRNLVNEFHPAQKPVALAGRAIRNGGKHRGTVLALFGGSASTMTGPPRVNWTQARLVELEPAATNSGYGLLENIQVAEKPVEISFHQIANVGGLGNAVSFAGVFDILHFDMIVGESAVYFCVVIDVHRSNL